MSRKFTVSLLVNGGREAGSTDGTSGGGAACVGNNCSKDAVAVGEAGGAAVGGTIMVGRIASGSGFESLTRSNDEVGVTSDGWNGVGVGLAFAAGVIKTNGRGACSVAGGAHEVNIIVARTVDVISVDGFIDVFER